MNTQILICLFLFASLAGCSGMRQIDCQSADWKVIGFEDGEIGKTVSEIEGYKETCAGQGATVDVDAYNSGHEEGVRVYCQPENGFELGQTGVEYAAVCPADLSMAFLQEYIEGSRFYPYYRNINEREMAIVGHIATIGSLESSIASGYVRMDSPGITHSERNQIRQNIDAMKSQINQRELSIDRLESELAEWSSRLQEMKARYGR